jgi:putative ABC transport system permease protein
MNLFECLRVALRGLASNKTRTALTMMGIIIGVSVVIIVVAIGEGATQRVTDAVNSLGTNLLSIRAGASHLRINAVTAKAASGSNGSTTSAPSSVLGPANHLTLEDAVLIAQEFKNTVAAVAPVARDDDLPIRMGDVDAVSDIFGTTPEYAIVNNAPIKRGRYFTSAEVDGSLKVCLVGASIAEKLTGDADADLVGQDIAIQRQNFKIVGMMVPKGTGAWGQDQDDQILVPITTAMDRIFNQRYINSIGVRCATQQMMPLAQEQISNFLRSRHHLQPPFPDNDDFNIRSQTELMERQRSVTDTMTSLLSIVAAVSLVVGGIGIMNIMLVSVTERTREIGIRKAVGATPRDILLQFLIEAAVISLIGGLIGIGLGVGGAHLLATIGGWSTIVNSTAVIAALAVSASVGLFFGIYPASRAAALHPIDALRFE